MLFYLLKFSSCLLILLTVYKLFLEKESIHTFKRFYLLSALVAALAIPLITFNTYVEPVPVSQEVVLYPAATPVAIQKTDNGFNIAYITILLWGLYMAGMVVLSVRFLFNLGSLTKTVLKNEKVKSGKITLVLLLKHITPHTFLSYIFLDKQLFDAHQISEEVLLHEETHARQKHSLDILAIELLQIVFWFNPLIYLLKKEIKLNHEYLADREVINKGVDPKKYFEILINHSSLQQSNQLTNAINYSSIKKRISVMKTNTSRRAAWLKTVALVPLVCLLVYGFSEKKEVLTESTNATPQNVVKTDTGKTQQTITKEAYYKNARFVFEDGNGNTFTKTWSELTTEEKAALSGPRPLPTKNPPSQIQLSEWQDADKYRVYINGALVSNKELANYQPADLGFYLSSEPDRKIEYDGKDYFTIKISTLAYYEKLIKEGVQPLPEGVFVKINPANHETLFEKYKSEGVTSVQDLIKLFKKKYEKYEALRNQNPHYIKRSIKEQNKLEDMFAELHKIYGDLSPEDRTKVPFPQIPSYPYFKIVNKDGSVDYKLQSELTAEDYKVIPPPPPATPKAPPVPAEPQGSATPLQEVKIVKLSATGNASVNSNYQVKIVGQGKVTQNVQATTDAYTITNVQLKPEVNNVTISGDQIIIIDEVPAKKKSDDNHN